MSGWAPYVITALGTVAMALAGIVATDIGPWYRALRKPSWQPPDWLFGPAWTTIYVFIVAAIGQGWNHAPAELRGTIFWLVVVNFVLNALWSTLFFKLRRPDLALVEVVPLWLSIAALMVLFADFRPLAAWLLLPYLLWVGFAAFLTLTIVRLNGARPNRGAG